MNGVEQEQKDVIAKFGSKITMEALNSMENLHRCVQEAIRLHPPLIILLRYVHKTFTVTNSQGKNFTIPKVIFVGCSNYH